MNKKLLVFIALISISTFIIGCTNQNTKEIKIQPTNITQTKTDNITKPTTKYSTITNSTGITNVSKPKSIDNMKNSNLENSKSICL